jgi:hypothetical protein
MADEQIQEAKRRFAMCWERPSVYRYRVAHPSIRVAWNRYPGALIGVALVVGRYAYCVKWGRPGAVRS